MDFKEKVLQALKTKAKSLGFNEKELTGVLTALLANLEEDAEDGAIDTAVDNILPFLKVSQSATNRIVNAEKAKLKTESVQSTNTESTTTETTDKDDEEPAWFKQYRKMNDERIQSLLNEKTTETRREIYSKQLEGLSDKHKKIKLMDFERLSFKDDEDFTSYIEEQKPLIDELIQDTSDDTLGRMRKPFGGNVNHTGAKPSDEQLMKVFGKH